MSLLENAPGGGFMITKRRRYVLEVGEPVLARHVTLSASAARKYPSLWPLKRSECLCQRQTATTIFEVWRSRTTWHWLAEGECGARGSCQRKPTLGACVRA